ncbi:hypothetical protein [Pseudoalteromonas sp. HF66]|uniref:hypothetical protein n=1 Tax=Pseudoalteromonas sp. HF66 TaxID=2721559 RepID=UPI0014310507|nr:hypothetical protein [Pseudoalteromonas sp. HF66]NIZ05446.1 hypothetical protein [Pseudoalteromonas sp. HF66]
MSVLTVTKSPSGPPTSSSSGPSSHPGPGGNWPSTSGKPSGGGRVNGPSKSTK